jgi:signal transduction histidine kinase
MEHETTVELGGHGIMWKLFGLRPRILIMLFLLVFITVGGALVSIWNTHMMEGILQQVVGSQLPALQAAQELINALVMQKGYVTYYFQTKDPRWLEELKTYDQSFHEWLKKARRLSESEEEREIINEIDSRYIRYSNERDRVIDLYKAGNSEIGFELHKRIRQEFFRIIDLCDRNKELHKQSIARSAERNRRRVESVYSLAMMALLIALVLGLVLAYTLTRQVLGPIRELAVRADGSDEAPRMADEVKVLSQRFQHLMSDVEQTRSKLEWSREHLLQAEKWAVLGKLAAGVAHSVRNPLTSVKMRLFSLERSLHLSSDQKEDFEVISEAMRQIDSIVTNFLEFSRPPKLKMRVSSPSDAVDMAIQLLAHRLESYNVSAEVCRDGRLPEITMDPDQLKEVLVNLMVNSCEAMADGGTITVEEHRGESDEVGEVVIIRVTDSGPGIPESVQAKLFQPFFSTKDQGTGLGLSIATRIVEEHGGWLDVESKVGQGATFIITLPVREED